MTEAIIYSLGNYTKGMPQAILLYPVVAIQVMEIFIKKKTNLFDFMKKYFVCEVGALRFTWRMNALLSTLES